jgi:hypothetical protein
MIASIDSASEPVFFDFVEIGTADFDTLIEKADQNTRGISIEPVGRYLSNLPNKAKCLKVNAAISNYDGEARIFLLNPEMFAQYGLPDWLRGCSSINDMHPTVLSELNGRSIDFRDVGVIEKIPVFRLKTLLIHYDVGGVYLLKIDTEGHDTVILKDFFRDAPRRLWPHRISFENNVLSDNDAIQETLWMLISMGYDLISFGENTEFALNLRRCRRGAGFSQKIDGYYLSGYPEGFEPQLRLLPYENTLTHAKRYCADHECGGVTYQDGRFEIRAGTYLRKDAAVSDVCSWIYY